MRKKTVLPLLLLLLATVVLSWSAATWKSDVAFVYPDITAFNSTTAKKRACRVPEEVAKNMTTRALAETVLNYPFLLEMYAFDSADLWFQGFKSLPMVNELCARPDCLPVLRAEVLKALEEENDDLYNDDLYYYITLIGCMERNVQK